MKFSQYSIGLVFILGCATGAAVRELISLAHAQGQAQAQGQGQGQAQAQAQAQAQKEIAYQYTTVSLLSRSPDEKDLELNRMGRSGWRVVAIADRAGEYLLEKTFPISTQSPPSPPAKR